MNEIKQPDKRPLIYYYLIAIVVVLLLNSLLVPMYAKRSVKEVDYGTFMTMTEDNEISKVEIESNKIIFEDKNSQVYQTGIVSDPELTDRLHEHNVEFSGQIVEQTSPIVSFLVSWVLPIAIFWALGQYLSKRMMKNLGGPDAMSFGMGKSNARVYVKSSNGIRFSDVAGED